MKDELGYELYPGEEFDWNQPDIDTNSREFLIAFQPSMRRDATAAGNFRTCRLPKCRRSKRCTGRHPMERLAIPGEHWSTFPPCIDTHEKQVAMLEEGRKFIEALDARLRARGIDPETYGKQ